MSRFGTVGQQYFDNSGKPLSAGTLTFYEPGTTDAKTVYSDESLSTAIGSVVTLDASGRLSDVFFSGQVKVVLADSDGVQIDVTDPEGIAPTEQFPSWDSAVSYSQGAMIQGSDDLLYFSLGNSNLNNDPTSTTGFWTLGNIIIEYNASYTFNADNLAFSGGAIWRCVTDSTTGVTPSASASQWERVSSPPAKDFTITDGASVTIDPENGDRQTWVMTADRTPTLSLEDNAAVLLRLQSSGGSWAITLTGATIVNDTTFVIPTSGYLQVLLYKVGSTLYAADAGTVT